MWLSQSKIEMSLVVRLLAMGAPADGFTSVFEYCKLFSLFDDGLRRHVKARDAGWPPGATGLFHGNARERSRCPRGALGRRGLEPDRARPPAWDLRPDAL